MAGHVAEVEVLGPWSLQTSRRFWEGFTPQRWQASRPGPGCALVFCAEGDWRRAEAEVTQAGDTARVVLAGDGDLDAAAGQVCRFLALDVDGGGWPQVGRRDPVIADPQARYFGVALSERTLVPGANARLGVTHFEDWLSQPTGPR